MQVLRVGFVILFIFIAVCLKVNADDIEKIIFDEQFIKGKIRRPQMILIKADQRPEFGSMIMKSTSSNMDVDKLIEGSALKKSPYKGAFEFEDKRISNYVP